MVTGKHGGLRVEPLIFIFFIISRFLTGKTFKLKNFAPLHAVHCPSSCLILDTTLCLWLPFCHILDTTLCFLNFSSHSGHYTLWLSFCHIRNCTLFLLPFCHILDTTLCLWFSFCHILVSTLCLWLTFYHILDTALSFLTYLSVTLYRNCTMALITFCYILESTLCLLLPFCHILDTYALSWPSPPSPSPSSPPPPFSSCRRKTLCFQKQIRFVW